MKYEEIKYRLAYIYKLFCIPAIYIHEISHALMCYLLFIPIFEINIDIKQAFSFVRFARPNNYLAIFLVNMSPIMVYLLLIALCMYNNYFMIALIYLLCAYKVSLPSKQDFENIIRYEE